MHALQIPTVSNATALGCYLIESYMTSVIIPLHKSFLLSCMFSPDPDRGGARFCLTPSSERLDICASAGPLCQMRPACLSISRLGFYTLCSYCWHTAPLLPGSLSPFTVTHGCVFQALCLPTHLNTLSPSSNHYFLRLI